MRCCKEEVCYIRYFFARIFIYFYCYRFWYVDARTIFPYIPRSHSSNWCNIDGVFGFVIIGIFKPKFLMTDRRLSFQHRPSGYIGSFLIGMAFAAGWTPCTGPILVSVIALAATNPSLGVVYMAAYSLGFALPFCFCLFYRKNGVDSKTSC